MPLITNIKCRFWKGNQMNKDKKPIIVGRMKSGKFRYHIEDDVFDKGGLCRPLTATDYKHPVCVLEVKDDGDHADRQHMC